ncbi:hypothetical protein FRC09_020712 [Ceratobasidium sp. 395]|nr:hypothetical protein FRC09_020712 [Ceratobasidium sp. 395]
MPSLKCGMEDDPNGLVESKRSGADVLNPMPNAFPRHLLAPKFFLPIPQSCPSLFTPTSIDAQTSHIPINPHHALQGIQQRLIGSNIRNDIWQRLVRPDRVGRFLNMMFGPNGYGVGAGGAEGPGVRQVKEYNTRVTHACAKPRIGFTYDFTLDEEDEEVKKPAVQTQTTTIIPDLPPIQPVDLPLQHLVLNLSHCRLTYRGWLRLTPPLIRVNIGLLLGGPRPHTPSASPDKVRDNTYTMPSPLSHAKPGKRRRVANSLQATTPKKSNTLSASPLTSKTKLPVGLTTSPSSPATPRAKSVPLPSHLSRLVTAHTAIESSLSLSLATSSRTPSAETGHLAAITNTVALETAGLRVRLGTDGIRRLCWLWEWNRDALPEDKPPKTPARAVGPIEDSSEDNPFLESNTPRKPVPAPAPPPTDWVHGGMGLIITPTTQLQRAQGRRMPAYGVGIKVEVASEKSTGVALSAVAKWTADFHLRRKDIADKLQRWVKLHEASQVTPKANGKTKRLRSLSPTPVPHIPLTDLPSLASIPITSTPSTLRTMQTPSKGLFSTPSRGSISTPSFARCDGGSPTLTSSTRSAFATPKSSIGGIFSTPTSVHRSGATTPSVVKRALAMPPTTPTTRAAGIPLPPTPAATPGPTSGLEPQTPQRDKSSTPSAPTTPRQAALAERLRQKALATPNGKTTTVTLSYDAETNTVHTADLTPAQLRRRCLLARLPDAAESLLAIFATRRVIPFREATRGIVSASRVTAGEAEDEVRMLAELCPKFLKIRVVEKEE